MEALASDAKAAAQYGLVPSPVPGCPRTPGNTLTPPSRSTASRRWSTSACPTTPMRLRLHLYRSSSRARCRYLQGTGGQCVASRDVECADVKQAYSNPIGGGDLAAAHTKALQFGNSHEDNPKNMGVVGNAMDLCNNAVGRDVALTVLAQKPQGHRRAALRGRARCLPGRQAARSLRRLPRRGPLSPSSPLRLRDSRHARSNS